MLQIQDVSEPRPGRRDLLIRVHAAAVTVHDIYIRSVVPTAQLWFRVLARLAMGLTKPRRPILGAERVYAFTTMRMGAYAE